MKRKTKRVGEIMVSIMVSIGGVQVGRKPSTGFLMSLLIQQEVGFPFVGGVYNAPVAL